jgi:hypothetical protein
MSDSDETAARYTPRSMPHTDDDLRAKVTSRIIDFVKEIGLEVRIETIPGETFLPGIVVHEGTLVVDFAQLMYPGDILHEAGHLAVMEPGRRHQCHIDVGNDGGEEMMAIAWSYAACVHLGLSASIVFHEGGYRGESQWLLENFNQGRYIAVPTLQWVGMTVEPKQAVTGVMTYPHMLRWLRG